MDRRARRRLIGIVGESPERRAEAVNRRIEAGAEQRPDQEFRLLPCYIPRISSGMDHRPNAVIRQRITLALQRDPFDVRAHLRHRRSAQFVVGAEHVNTVAA